MKSLKTVALGVPILAMVGLGAGVAMAQAIPDATIQISDTQPVEGQVLTITNTDDDASRCEGGLVVVFVEGAPPGILSQLVVEPDEAGDWSTTWTVLIQAEWPSNYVGGPFVFQAICTTNELTETAQPMAQPEFDYLPVTVTVAQVVPTTTTTAPAAAAAAAATPAFTG